MRHNVPHGALRQGPLTPRAGYVACNRMRCSPRVSSLPIGCVRHHTHIAQLSLICTAVCAANRDPAWGTRMWHECVAVALAVSAGWRPLADLLEAHWLSLDTVQQPGEPTGVVWRLVHPGLPSDPLSTHPDVDVLLTWHGAVVVRDGAPVAAGIWGPIDDRIRPGACGLSPGFGACGPLVCPCPTAPVSRHARPVFSDARVIWVLPPPPPPRLGGASGSVGLLSLATGMTSGPRFVSRQSPGSGSGWGCTLRS